MKVLVINCGSSSLKYQLIDSETEVALASGICERIRLDGTFKYKAGDGNKIEKNIDMPDHEVAVKAVLDALVDKEYGVIESLDEIQAIGHRVVHGGEKFASSVVIDDEVLDAIAECNDLAPLHNPANIIGIKACQAIMPGVPNVAVFDTAFHQTMPKKAFMYGLPVQYYEDYKVRRYGFHGTSHSYVSKYACDVYGHDPKDSKIVVCHLGGGASVTAVLNGESVDTTMGLTPLEGLIMGTRSGSIDPAIIEYLMKKTGKSIDEIMNVLNKESGVFGLSRQISSDFRDLNKAANEGDELAALCLEAFSYIVAKYIGSYTAAMHGLDAIVFTAGVGENDPVVRKLVCEYFDFLGVEIDDEINKIKGEELTISTADSKVKVYVIPTNEELAIARETVALV